MSTIFGNHVTAGVLWVKVTVLSGCQQTKWRPDRTKFDGEIVSQTRVPPVSTPMNNLFSTPRVKKTHIFFLSIKFVIAELLPFSKFFILLHCKPIEACEQNISRTA